MDRRIDIIVTPCRDSRHSDLTPSMTRQLATRGREPQACVAVHSVGAQTSFTLEPCSDAPEQHTGSGPPPLTRVRVLQ